MAKCALICRELSASSGMIDYSFIFLTVELSYKAVLRKEIRFQVHVNTRNRLWCDKVR